VDWGKTLPIPKTDAERFPEVKKLLDQGLQSLQYTFSVDDLSQADKLFRGASPSNDGTELTTAGMPEGVPIKMAPERREEFSPVSTPNCSRCPGRSRDGGTDRQGRRLTPTDLLTTTAREDWTRATAHLETSPVTVPASEMSVLRTRTDLPAAW